MRGGQSLNFLLRELEKDNNDMVVIIDALWQRKKKVPFASRQQLKQFILRKAHQARIKIIYYRNLEKHKIARLLHGAIRSELHDDIQILLKALSLIYDADKIQRVMELLKRDHTSRISNAIEMLEIIIPNKYFIHVNELLELFQEINKDEVAPHGKMVTINKIIEEILDENKAEVNQWTSSIACYLLPRIKDRDFALGLMNNQPNTGDHLFNETKNYVLSMLK
jgi:hypothetical protein